MHVSLGEKTTFANMRVIGPTQEGILDIFSNKGGMQNGREEREGWPCG